MLSEAMDSKNAKNNLNVAAKQVFRLYLTASDKTVDLIKKRR